MRPRRAILTLLIAVGLTLGGSFQATAFGETQVVVNCGDGDNWSLAVDAQTLAALTSAIQAMLENPAGMECTLTQVAAPLVTFGHQASAASGGYAIGGGTVIVQGGCPNSTATFVGTFAVKIRNNDQGAATGSASLKVGSGQCVGPSTLSSTATCLAVFPLGLGSWRAWANTFVTSTTGAYFAPHSGKTIGWAFEDNGPRNSPTADRFRVEERPGSCPVYGDPNQNFYELVKGDLTVRP